MGSAWLSYPSVKPKIFIEERFYENLCKVLNKKVEVSGVIKGEDFNTDYAISLGGDGTSLRAASKVGGEENTNHRCKYGTLGLSCQRAAERD